MSTTNVILRQGVVAAQNREFDRARALLQQVTTETPDDVIAWYWLAIASPSADAAIPCLRRVLTLDEDHAPAREALSRLLISEARAAAAAGTRDHVRAFTTEATELTPDLAAPWQAIAELATSQVERIDALRRLVKIAPEHGAWRTQLRQALLARAVTIASDDREEARSRFREAAALNPNDVRIWQALANLADSDEGRLQPLRELLRVAPHHEEGRAVLRKSLIESARALSAAGKTAQSLERWNEAIAVSGGDVEVWLGLAATTEDQDEAARAIQAAQAIDADDPRIAAALDWLNGPQVDPTVLPDPGDAFARFGAGVDAPPPAAAPDVVDDSLLDALATLPQPDPAAPPQAEPAQAELPQAELPQAEPAMPPRPIEVPAAEPVAINSVAPQPAAEPAAEPVAPPPAAVTAAAAEGTPTILVVDDSPTIRKILVLTLERAGYRVFAEPDGTSALQRLEEVVPHVVLLDIAMPDLDGYEVCKRIKQDPRTQAVPVIMLSGKGAFFDKVKGHMAGATEYLTKPFETPAVLAIVTSHCQAEARHG